MHDNVIGSSDPKSCVEETEIGAKTEVRADEAEAEEEDTAEDDKTANEAEEMAAEEMRKATERRCLRRERRRADLVIGDKESGKRHSSDDNTPKRLDTGRGGKEAEDEKTEEDEAEGETEAEETGKAEETEEPAGDEEVETWFKVGERQARFEVVAPGCILAP